MLKTKLSLLLLGAAASYAAAQGAAPAIEAPVPDLRPAATVSNEPIFRPTPPSVPNNGRFSVRTKDIARFRGMRSNQISGIGLVVGLEGTGDSKKSPFTVNFLANLLRDAGAAVNPAQMDAKNVAAVMVTAELPPFAMPGQQIDVTVQSIGDAKSLKGGTLLQTPLYAAGNRETVYVAAMGSVSIGGFLASGGGSSVTKNHQTVGRVVSGGIVERSVPTRMVFNGKLYLELDDEDLTTAQRLTDEIALKHPEFEPVALSSGTIQLTKPAGMSDVAAMSLIEGIQVDADIPATIVINERTGSIAIGGNVTIGPAAIAHGSLNIKIQQFKRVVQPFALSEGVTAVEKNTQVQAIEETTQIAGIPSFTTVEDLVRIFRELNLKANDIIAILQLLKQQGALKARIEFQ